jgi:hypothetical protein
MRPERPPEIFCWVGVGPIRPDSRGISGRRAVGSVNPGHRPTGRCPGLYSRDPSGRKDRRPIQQIQSKVSQAGRDAGAPREALAPASGAMRFIGRGRSRELPAPRWGFLNNWDRLSRR